MYAIYVDDYALYHPNLVESGSVVLKPKLTLQLNKAGSLTFLLPPSNPTYDYIQKLKSVITVTRDGEEIFRGRVLHDDKDYHNRKQVYCEGDLSFLLDSIQRPYTFDGSLTDLLKQIVANHNTQVDEWKCFEPGDISEKFDDISVPIENTNYSKSLDALSDLVSKYGGYLVPCLRDGVRYLDYVDGFGTDYIQDDYRGEPQYGKKNSQTIQFGVNLLDLSEYIDASEVYTVLIPLGGGQNGSNRIDITSVNDGKDYIEDEAGVSLFGKVWQTKTWEYITDPTELLETAKADLSSGIEMAISLTVTAADLHAINVNAEAINLGDHVRVISVPHNIDKYFLCSKIVIDLFNADNTEITLGIEYRSLTEHQMRDTKVIRGTAAAAQATAQSAANTAQTAANTAGKASETANSVEQQMTSEGIFKILTNNGRVQGLILDEKTGDIYINATYIKSGTLTLGGANALMQVLDSDGVVRVTVDDSGIHILGGEINATGGTLENMSIVDGITISSKGDSEAQDIPVVSIETVTDDYGTYKRVTFGSSSTRTTPVAMVGSTVVIKAATGITFSADNIIFENSIEVPDIYVTKGWTPLTLENGFLNGEYEADQLEYKTIGKHVYIRGSVQFPESTAWTGSPLTVAFLPSAIKPTRGNHYVIAACGGSRVARILVTTKDLKLEWIRLLSDGTPDTTTTGLWVAMTMDYWID